MCAYRKMERYKLIEKPFSWKQQLLEPWQFSRNLYVTIFIIYNKTIYSFVIIPLHFMFNPSTVYANTTHVINLLFKWHSRESICRTSVKCFFKSIKTVFQHATKCWWALMYDYIVNSKETYLYTMNSTTFTFVLMIIIISQSDRGYWCII